MEPKDSRWPLPRPSPQDVESAIVCLLPTIDLLVVVGTVGGIAAKKLVTTKPVVFISVGAPVEIGLVESLSHPGGNMTGMTFEAATETYAKRLEILKEIVPKLNRVAILQAKEDANIKFAMASLERAAPDLGVQSSTMGVSSSTDIEGAFDEMKRSQTEGLIVIAGLLTYRNGQLIADLALTRRLPSCHAFRETVAVGGLVSLGPDLVEVWADRLTRLSVGHYRMTYRCNNQLGTSSQSTSRPQRRLTYISRNHCSRAPTWWLSDAAIWPDADLLQRQLYVGRLG